MLVCENDQPGRIVSRFADRVEAWSSYINCYTLPFMGRTATLPPIRIAPETRASLEAVLREGESLTQFIESAVRREAEFRAEQRAASARAKKALRSADKGAGVMTADDFLSGMQQRAKAAQGRIRAAVAARNKRAAG
jgi:hypothetical protein